MRVTGSHFVFEYAGPYLSPEVHGKDLDPLIESHCKASGIKAQVAGQFIYLYNALALLKHQLYCIGVKDWKGEVTEIERLEIDQANKALETALHLAVMRSNLVSVKALLKARACIEVKNSSGKTALHLAAMQGNAQMVQTLLYAKANPDAETGGKSCLEIAVIHSSCATVLKRVGADGWTPLMVAAEKGGSAVEEYLQCREFCLSVQSREPFRQLEIFSNEVQFYSGLSEVDSTLEWGQKWSKLSGAHISNLGAVDINATLFSCALGKDAFTSGIHIWKVLVADFQGKKAWIGVARNEDVTCEPQNPKSSQACYIVYFESEGTEGVLGVAQQQSKPVFVDKIGDSSFSSGQTVELRLDTFKKSLELRLDGLTKRVVHNIDTRKIHPYVRFEKFGSATLEYVCSLNSTATTFISEGERSAGFDNTLWSYDLDKALLRCFKPGN
jgi:hypothetical protein